MTIFYQSAIVSFRPLKLMTHRLFNQMQVPKQVASLNLILGLLPKTLIMSTIFDEFYNSDSKDEAPPNQNQLFSEANRLTLANIFEIFQTPPTLRNIAVLS